MLRFLYGRLSDILLISISILVGMLLLGTAYFFSGAGNQHNELIKEVKQMHETVRLLEKQKHPATAKRFTSDHGKKLIACQQLPKKQQNICLENLRREL